MTLLPWWERWPGRLEWELESFHERGLEFTRDEEQWAKGRVVLRGRAPSHSGDLVDLIVVFPDTYPHTRFETYAPKLALSRHQNPFAKNLCLIPRGSEYWRPSMCAAEVIATGLQEVTLPPPVEADNPSAATQRAAEVQQGEPFSSYYPCCPSGSIIVPDEMLSIDPGVDLGNLVVRFGCDGFAWLTEIFKGSSAREHSMGQALLETVKGPDNRVLGRADACLSAIYAGLSLNGLWARLNRPFPFANPEEFLAEAWKHHPSLERRSGIRVGPSTFLAVYGFVFKEEVRQNAYEDAWLFVATLSVKKETRGVFLSGMRLGREDIMVRIPELRPVVDKKASIVGLGALGSPLALELAKAQVGRLAIADMDRVEPGNMVRWAYGLSAAGSSKSLFIATEIRRQYPFTLVDDYEIRVGDAGLPHSPTRESDLLREWSDGAALLIDATAETNVSRVVNDLALEMNVPHIYLWSVDGIGGVVARLIPGKTGCFHCLQVALSNGTIHPPIPVNDRTSVGIQPRGCGDITFTGVSVDMSPLMIEAARFALSTLCSGAPNSYPSQDYDVLVFQIRDGDRSLLPSPVWQPYRLDQATDCPVCSSPR